MVRLQLRQFLLQAIARNPRLRQFPFQFGNPLRQLGTGGAAFRFVKERFLRVLEFPLKALPFLGGNGGFQGKAPFPERGGDQHARQQTREERGGSEKQSAAVFDQEAE
jgi:hypothetical protein